MGGKADKLDNTLTTKNQQCMHDHGTVKKEKRKKKWLVSGAENHGLKTTTNQKSPKNPNKHRYTLLKLYCNIRK